MELLERSKLIKLASADANVMTAAYQMAKNNTIDFVNAFGWIYEPRSGLEHHVLVNLYKHEEDIIKWVEERFKRKEDGLIEKSRDMGVTWTACVFWVVWHWLFDEDFDVLIGSRKEDLVDNRLPDSIFGKIDYFIDHLPSFLKPVGFEPVKHRNHLKIINPENGNTIVGEATNPNFSRGSRFSCIILDEFAFVEKSYLIWQSCGDSTSVRIAISTPNGKGNKFADLALNTPISKLTVHWHLHPEKTQAWYEKEKLRRTPDEVAQELDISYTRSTRGRVYGEEWDQLEEEGRLTDVPYDPLLEVYTSWDFGISTTAIGFYQVNAAGAVHMIDYYENSGYSVDHYIKIVQDKEKASNWRFGAHYGDIAGNAREIGTGKTVFEILRLQGIKMKGLKIKKINGINAAKLLLRKMYVDRVKCNKFVDSIQNYHFEWDDERQEFGVEPYADWSKHAADELEYFAINFKQALKEDRRPIKRKFDPYAITTY